MTNRASSWSALGYAHLAIAAALVLPLTAEAAPSEDLGALTRAMKQTADRYAQAPRGVVLAMPLELH